MANAFLQDAISKVERSEGDASVDYQQVLIRQAQLRLQISIAISLEKISDYLETLAKIANTLDEIKNTNEQKFNFTVNKTIHGKRGLP